MLIDTHCHLNDQSKFTDVSTEIEDALLAGVNRMIVVGVKPDEWEYTLTLAQKFSPLYCILGWHPNYTKDYRAGELAGLRSLASDPKCLAIGEIGLDYHWDYSPKETQYSALIEQLDLALEMTKPVVFHAREAYGDLLTLLESRPPQPYLLHCFSGNLAEAARAIDLDCYFGVDGPITYKKSAELREVISSLPIERLVLETDAPYLSPEPHRGKTNRPAYIPLINNALATLKSLSPTDLAEKTSANALRFFGSMD